MNRNKTKSRSFALLMALILIFNIIPFGALQVHAFEQDKFKVDTVTIFKIFDSNRNIEQRRLLITGSYLKDAEVGIITSTGYNRLTQRTVNTEGILQFDIDSDQLGNSVLIEGISIDINEEEMPTLTGVSRKVKEGSEDLIIKGTKLTNINEAGKNITAGYEHEGAYTPINDSDIASQSDSQMTVMTPQGALGLQHIIFEKVEDITGVYFNDENPSATVKINIKYTYKDQFRLYKDIVIHDSLKMYPNRGQEGDKVYFEADAGTLDSYDVFFLKQTDGTDPYTEANKGQNKTFLQNINGKDILTVEVPGIEVGEYHVVFTNAVTEGKDPMEEVTMEKILGEKFTVISANIKSRIISINPKSGPDTGSKATISAQFIGTLNVPEFVPDSDTKVYTFSDADRELVVDYGAGAYNGSSGYKATRTIRVIIGDEASFLKKSDHEPDVTFTKDLDTLNIMTAQITDADVNPLKDVVIEMETIIEDSSGNVVQTISDRAVLEEGYTYIPSKVEPVVESITPEKIRVVKLGDEDKYQTGDSEIMIAIHGKNFMVHKYTDSSGKDIVRYPIVELGPDIKLNPNLGDPDYTDGLEMKVLNSSGQELDGSEGNEVGTKILFYLPPNKTVTNIGKTYVRVINPIRNSIEPGLAGTKVDSVEFVLVDDNKMPIITGVNPDNVSVEGGVEVKITGNNFMEGVRLFLDGEEINKINRGEDGKEITFEAPAGREGTTQILVMNPEGGFATWPFNYVKTYTNPKITDFAPKSGNTGTLVVVKGENFIPPDPTDSTDLKHRLIGTRILLGGMDINDYELDSFKRIVLKPYEDPEEKPVISLKTEESVTTIDVASYYYSVIFQDENGNYYTISIDGSGAIILSDGVHNIYTLVIDGGEIKADKKDGSMYNLSSDKYGITILDGDTEILKLTMLTPYKTDAEGNIIGNRVKVVDKNTIYFTVPALPADGYYDVTVLNPDTKRDEMTGTNGFLYFSHPQSKPEIHRIVPDEGTSDGGYAIDIEGEDFMDIQIDKSKVFINGIQVDEEDILVSPNGKTITVKRVPPYPGDLFAEKGTNRYAVPVVVVNPDGGSVSLEKGFTYTVPTSHPKLIKILPAAGTAAGGEVVEITGTDFRFFEPFDDTNRNGERDEYETYRDINGNGEWDSEINVDEWIQKVDLYHPVFDQYLYSEILPKVFFGDNLAKIVEFSRGYLKVITPEGNAGKVDVYIVNNDAGTSDKLSYTYEASNPKITRVFPKEGKMQGGDTIELLGNSFAVTNMEIYNGNVDGSGLALYDTKQMTAVRFGSLTNRNIPREMENSGRIDNRRTTVRFEENRMSFEYDASGSTTKLTMSKIVDDKIYRAVINGYDDTVKYIPLSLMETDGGEKYEATGLVRVEVIDGRLFIDTGYSEYVRYVDSGQVFVTAPTHHTIGSNIPIELINPDKGTATATFEYKNPYDFPIITSIEPINKVLKSSSGIIVDYEGTPESDDQEYYTYVPVNGGVLLTIRGSNFKRNVTVYLDDQPLQILDKSTNGDWILVAVPATDESDIGHKKPITVDNGDGGITSTREPNDYYKMNAPYFVVYQKGLSGPLIEEVIPDKTSSRGQNEVTIIGSDFRPGVKVFIGGIEAEVLEQEGTEKIKVTVPLGLIPGKASVMVQNADYGSDELKDALTIISSPDIEEILDENGSTFSSGSFKMTGGQNIILKGIEFQQGAKVIFGGTIKTEDELESGETGILCINIDDEEVYVVGGTQASVEKVEDETFIYATTPSMAEGSSSIIVINPDGGVSEPFSITVIRPLPDKPSNVKATAVDGDTIRLVWRGDADIYQIFGAFGEKSSSSQLNDYNYMMTAEPERTEKGELVYYVRGLVTDTYYRFRIYAVNDFGLSQDYATSNKVKTPETISSEAMFNDEYISPSAVRDWTESTKELFIYNVGEKSLKEGSQYHQIELRTHNIEPGAARQIKIPVKLLQDYNKNYNIWDEDISLKFHTVALRNEEIMSVKNNLNDAAAVIELYTPKGREYDNILLMLNRREKPIKLIGIDFYLQEAQKTTKMQKFNLAINAQIVLDSIYDDVQNLELYYYDIPSNKMEKLDFTRKPEHIINTQLKKPGQYVIISR